MNMIETFQTLGFDFFKMVEGTLDHVKKEEDLEYRKKLATEFKELMQILFEYNGMVSSLFLDERFIEKKEKIEELLKINE